MEDLVPINKRLSTEQEVLEQLAADGVEYVRFETVAVNGVLLGKYYPIRHSKSVIRNGVPMVNCYFMTADDSFVFEDFNHTGYRNAYCKICPDTYTLLPYHRKKTASILVYFPLSVQQNPDGIYMDPRSVAAHILNEQFSTLHSYLNENNNNGPTDAGMNVNKNTPKPSTVGNLGNNAATKCHLLSAFEHEFMIVDAQTGLPMARDLNGCYSNHRVLKFEQFFTSVDECLSAMNIDLINIGSEAGLGQFEISNKPNWNEWAADDAIRIKQVLKEIPSAQHFSAGFQRQKCTFVTDPFAFHSEFPPNMCNGSHFNHSLWDASKQKNLFYDANTTNKISEIGRHWIGGIFKHIQSITAFCCPTGNCYRRFRAPFVWKVCYGCHNRWALLRVKIDGQKTHFEFRLPSGLSNPYLVMASVVLSGLDGVLNKIEPSEEVTITDDYFVQLMATDKYPRVASDLDTALYALESDELFRKAFHPKFITYYVNSMRLQMMDHLQHGSKSAMFAKL